MRTSYSQWLIVVPYTILWITSSSLAWPVRSKLKDPAKMSHDSVYNYLMEFGYLPKSDIETGNLRTEAQLKDAIRNLQRFGNVPETGEIDGPTRKLILKPRCGVPDKMDAPDFSPDNLGGSRWFRDSGGGGHRRRPKRFVIQGAKWDHTDITWSLVNQTMSTLNAGEVRRVLTNALAVWERNSRLTFHETGSRQADIQVLFARQNHGDGYDFDGPGMILAHAFYPGEGRGGDAHFDEEELWLLNGTHTDEGTNLMGVAVHEFGHSLGLGHSSAEDAIMFPWYQGYQINGDLPEDDRLAVQQLYGTREKQWGPYNPQPPRPTRPTTTTTTTTTTTQKPLRYYPDRRDPEDPRRRPSYTDRDSPRYPETRPYYPRYPPNDPRYPQYPKTTPRHHHHNHTHHYPRPRPDYETPVRTAPPRTEAPPTPRYHHPTSTTPWPRHRHRTTARPPRKNKPDGCNTHYDAISMLRRELFIFRGQYLWRIGKHGLYKGYPAETRRLWNKLPENFTKIDAVYENERGKIVFFIGRQFFVFNSAELEYGYPRPLTDLGLPSYINKIDAALIWGYNNRTYLYSDTLYWRLDDETNKVELDYPRDMSIWDGIGYNIDSAFQYTNGKTYFFKGLTYWEFDDSQMRVAHYKPKLSAYKWMNCPRIESNEIDDNPTINAPLVSERNFPLTSAAVSTSRRSWSSSGFIATIIPLFTYVLLNSNYVARILF